MNVRKTFVIVLGVCLLTLVAAIVFGQLTDKTLTPNPAGAGINKSLAEQIGAGRGNISTPNSSQFIIQRDPFRSIRRGRQLFQRKFLRAQGQGPLTNDGVGDISSTITMGSGLGDSCAICHGRPRGSAGFGGDEVTRPDSRDAPHLFGLGLKEMLADEITAELRAIKANAIARARTVGRPVKKKLSGKDIRYGSITARPDGSVDTSQVKGVDPDLRVRPFFHHGETISIREFVVGAFKAEMGLEAVDPDLARASAGEKITTPSGMVLDGSLDQIEAPPTDSSGNDPDGDRVVNEIPESLVDHLEYYLLNYFKPAIYKQTKKVKFGRKLFRKMRCASCHIPNLKINRDRRVADIETVYNADRGIFNHLFSTATPLFQEKSDGGGPTLKRPKLQTFVVKNIFTDFKRHDLGPNFHERNYDGTLRREFLTTPLWGVGSTAPYGHDGRSINLTEVILRHGGEARRSRDAFASLPGGQRQALFAFLNSLVLFPPDDTASTLDPGDRGALNFPQAGHGSIKLTVLFNDPSDVE